MTVEERLSGYATAAASASRSTGGLSLSSATALVDAVGRLVDAAVARVLLSDTRVTSVEEGKLQLAGQSGTEELADKVQRVVVLATPMCALSPAARSSRDSLGS